MQIMTHEFKFKFSTREQFYGIVRLLNAECGKGNWTIKGKVLKGLKRIETTWGGSYINSTSYTPYVEKTVVVPEKYQHVDSILLFIYKDERIKSND